MILQVIKIRPPVWIYFICLFHLLGAFSVTAGKEGRQRGVSWVAFSEVVTKDQLQPLAQDNVNWIVQTPFGWQKKYNSTAIRMKTDFQDVRYGESDVGIAGTAKLAKELGIKTLLKPHIWLTDRKDGKWRSNIEMDNESDWIAWFESYQTFIVHYARLAEESGIEALCIGTELHQTVLQREQDWRKVIKAIRQVYGGKLVYAANWYKEFEDVPFWDALDFIGIQAYFPLVDHDNPTVDALTRGWSPHLAAIEQVQKRHQKSVIFTEIGYRSMGDAAIKPWEWPQHIASKKTDEAGFQTQAKCYEAFFQIFWEKEWLAGVYFWKWYPNYKRIGDRYARDFTPQDKPAEKVMRKWYLCE